MTVTGTVLEASEEFAVATRGRLLVTVWRGDVTTDRVASIDRVLRSLVPKCGEAGYGSITVIEPSISMRVSEEARTASTALQKRWAQHMKCSAYLVEGTGFLPAAVRTMTAGMHLITRSPYPIKVFADRIAVTEWVSPHVGLTSSEVDRTTREARSAR